MTGQTGPVARSRGWRGFSASYEALLVLPLRDGRSVETWLGTAAVSALRMLPAGISVGGSRLAVFGWRLC